MAKKFDELRRKMSPERVTANKANAERQLLMMSLQELRQNVTGYNQEDVAEMLKVTQGYISKLERRGDMLLSRLYAFVEALGGEVEIRARFPDQEVQIKQFQEVDKLEQVMSLPEKKTA